MPLPGASGPHGAAPLPPSAHGSRLADPFGSFLPTLVTHDLRDRLRGERARANARWGWLARPAGASRLVWIVAGATRASVRLAAELAQAVSLRREDVVVALTFEAEHADLVAPLGRYARVGWGYGPADHVGSLNALLRRFDPFGIVVAGVAPRANLARACAALRHTLLVAPPVACPDLAVEHAYPCLEAPWSGPATAPAADLTTLLTQAQVEPSLPALMNPGRERPLWWWHGDDLRAAQRFIALFRGHLREDVLVVSGACTAALPPLGSGEILVSRWQQEPVADGAVLFVDDPKWVPAIAACASSAHFRSPEPDHLWQALACGVAATRDPSVLVACPQAAGVVDTLADEDAVLDAWRRLRADPELRTSRADAARRAFSQVRHTAETVAGELLDRVLGWN